MNRIGFLWVDYSVQEFTAVLHLPAYVFRQTTSYQFNTKYINKCNIYEDYEYINTI